MTDKQTLVVLGAGLAAVWWWQRERFRKSIPPPGVMQHPSLPYGNYGQDLNNGQDFNNGGLSGDCPPGYVPGPRRPCWNGDCPPECVPIGGGGGLGGAGTITPTTYDWPIGS